MTDPRNRRQQPDEETAGMKPFPLVHGMSPEGKGMTPTAQFQHPTAPPRPKRPAASTRPPAR